MAIKLRGGSISGEGVALKALQPIGSNALNLHFSDGHERGIYPLAYLVELAASGVSAGRHASRVSPSPASDARAA